MRDKRDRRVMLQQKLCRCWAGDAERQLLGAAVLLIKARMLPAGIAEPFFTQRQLDLAESVLAQQGTVSVRKAEHGVSIRVLRERGAHLVSECAGKFLIACEGVFV